MAQSWQSATGTHKAGSWAERLGGKQTWLGLADMGVIGLVMLVVIMMVLPLPARVLDFLLAGNISFSLLILALSMNVRHVLDLSAFPTILLVATLFRLALNVSSTRLILLHGYAGEVINAFGHFVVGGNYVVGAVVFLILVIIQFVVITRGAERVAEVAARFTLDAMPGKQMSIDADLNAGIIDEDQARARRAAVEREADFYGAMDGASKFVKGDAIASIIITVINILAGFVVGLLQQGLSLAEALQRYTLLTVGDGLVAQVPALLVSTATGVIVTRAAAENNLGREVSRQLTADPQVLAVAATTLGLLGLVPGLPKLSFLTLAGLLGGIAYVLHRQTPLPVGATGTAGTGRARTLAPATVAGGSGAKEAAATGERSSEESDILAHLQVDPFELNLGYSLLPLVDNSSGGDLLTRISAIRRRLAWDLGFVVPPIRIRDSVELRPNEYRFLLRGVEVARGELLLDRLLAMNPGSQEAPPGGIETKEPAFGLPAWWVRTEDREKLETSGFTVVEPAAVLATHLTETLRSCAGQLLDRQEIRRLLDALRENYPAVVDEVTQVATLGDLQKVMQGLLAENVSCRDLVTVLETVADTARQTKDPVALVQAVRLALRRQITRSLLTEDGLLPAITLSPQGERYLLENLQAAPGGGQLPAIDPQELRQLAERLRTPIQQAAQEGVQPVLLVSAELRYPLRQLLERSFPHLAVLAYSEVAPGISVKSYGMVVWPDEG